MDIVVNNIITDDYHKSLVFDPNIKDADMHDIVKNLIYRVLTDMKLGEVNPQAMAWARVMDNQYLYRSEQAREVYHYYVGQIVNPVYAMHLKDKNEFYVPDILDARLAGNNIQFLVQ